MARSPSKGLLVVDMIFASMLDVATRLMRWSARVEGRTLLHSLAARFGYAIYLWASPEPASSKWHAALFVGWNGPSGRTSWAANVVEDGRGLGVEHWLADSDGRVESWISLPHCTPAQAIAEAQGARDALIQARRQQEGDPVVSDVFIDQLGGFDHMLALNRASISVLARAGRPRLGWKHRAPLAVAVAVCIASLVFLFLRLSRGP